ncbi:MAG: hypothetical protein GY793_01065 [Proteobacteria bacterium]|nr:hypothetical protein [Pseudomonadota bacterium]
MKNQKGIMFGLDARIALAIFGALSLIVGTALYSSIKKAKATAILTEMQEVGKAWESYYIDTGSNLAQISILESDYRFYQLASKYLVEKPSSSTGWNGPYLEYDISGDILRRNYEGSNVLTQVMIYDSDHSWSILQTDSDIALADSWQKIGHCSSGAKCSIWVCFRFKKNMKAIAQEINDKIDFNNENDKSDTYNNNMQGDFKWEYIELKPYTYFYLKIAPIKNPND